MDRTKTEYRKVRLEIASKLKESKRALLDLGDPRATTEQQRFYLGQVASRFVQLKTYALDAY